MYCMQGFTALALTCSLGFMTLQKQPFGDVLFIHLFIYLFTYLISYLTSMFTIVKKLIYIDNKKHNKMNILFILIYPLLTRRESNTPNTSIYPTGHVSSCQVRQTHTHTHTHTHARTYARTHARKHTHIGNIRVFGVLYCPVEKCGITPRCLYHDSPTLNIKFVLPLLFYRFFYCLCDSSYLPIFINL